MGLGFERLGSVALRRVPWVRVPAARAGEAWRLPTVWVLAVVVGLSALLGLVGCSSSEASSFLSFLGFMESSQVDGQGPCPEGTPVLSEIVEPEAVLRWAATVCAVFDPVDASTALCIISYESGGDPDSINPDDPGRGSFGLMQINSDWWIGSEYHERMVESFGRDDETYLDPAVNIGAAALLVNDPSLTGWHAWASSRLCPHRHHEHAA